MRPVGLLSLVAIPFAAGAPTSTHLASRDVPDEPFQLYAYGPGLGGLTLFSTGGNIYIGNYSTVNDSEAAPIVFTESPDKSWTGSPNITGVANNTAHPSWSNMAFSIPTANSTSHDVALLGSNSTTDRQTQGFFLFGSFAFVLSAEHKVEAAWYARQSEISGIYLLKWNVTDEDSVGTRVLLKSTPPSTS